MFDVIVVGARCSGGALGLLLARCGHRVLLVDRAMFPSDMANSTHLIHQRGVACLARWGLRDAVAAHARHPIMGCNIDMGPIQLSGAAPAVDGEACALAPRRIQLDEILVRAAVESGAVLREGCRVETLVSHDDRVSGVVGRTASGGAFVEKARVVVGADGPSSRVAGEAGAGKYNTKPALQGTAWIYWDGVPLDHFELHLRPFEAVYAFPTGNGSTLVGVNWSIDTFRIARGDIERSYFDVLGRVAPVLAERVGDAGRAEEKIRLGSTRNFFRTASGSGWVLLGDAHYTKDPCTAQGITDAFCDAECLAETLDQVLRGERDLQEALAVYEKERVAWAMPFYELTCEMATFAPLPPETQALYAALQGNREDTSAFIGLISEAITPAEFFSPENIGRILGVAQ